MIDNYGANIDMLFVMGSVDVNPSYPRPNANGRDGSIIHRREQLQKPQCPTPVWASMITGQSMGEGGG